MNIPRTVPWALIGIAFVSVAHAYSLDCKGDACKVHCDNGQYVGTMYWNGAQWSDGVRSDASKEVVAELMVKAQGTACQ